MPIKLSEITKANAPLVAAFQKFCKSVAADENFSFWFDNGNDEGKYNKYIKVGADKEINISSDLRKEFTQLAAAENWAGMAPKYVEARQEVAGMLSPMMGRFEASKEYRDYLAIKKAGNIKKALKVLGVTGSSAVAMEKLMKEYALGDAGDKRDALAKMDKIAKHDQIVAALKSSGLL